MAMLVYHGSAETIAAPAHNPLAIGPRLAGGERRRGLRVRQSRPVKVLEATGGRYYGGRTRDVSSTGLQVELPAHAAVWPGAILHIHVGVGDGGPLANRRHMVPARVVWVERTRWMAAAADDSVGATVLAGVEFAASISAELHAA